VRVERLADIPNQRRRADVRLEGRQVDRNVALPGAKCVGIALLEFGGRLAGRRELLVGELEQGA
jgi:hypothetical protein